MSSGDPATIDIEAFGIRTRLTQPGEWDRREGLVHFEQFDIFDRPASGAIRAPTLMTASLVSVCRCHALKSSGTDAASGAERGLENLESLLADAVLQVPLWCCCGLNPPSTITPTGGSSPCSAWGPPLLRGNSARGIRSRKLRTPLSRSSVRFPAATHQRTLTARAGCLLLVRRERR